MKWVQSQHDRADLHMICHSRQWAHFEACKQSKEADHDQQEAEITHSSTLLHRNLMQESCRVTWIISKMWDFNMSD